MAGMKESGIRWIGEIPENWNTKRIKYVASLKGRIGWQGLTSEEYQDEGAFLITGVDFLDGSIDWDNCVHVPMKRWEEAKEIQIENGDLLITKDGTVGKVAIVKDLPGETSLNSGVLRIMTYKGYSRRFLYWVLQSEEFWNWFNYKNAGNSTITHLYQGDFVEFLYAFPDYTEQEAIADYLDKYCTKIDSIVSDLENQIEILKKYKKSLITETVTKGLDKSVPMKDSGVEWVGNIPIHWRISRIRYVTEICSGATPSKDVDEYWEGNIPWISSLEVKKDVIDDTSLHISNAGMNSCSTQLIPSGTMIMVVRSGILQHTLPVALLGVPATINQDIKAIFCHKELSPAFLKYFIQGNNDNLLNTLSKDKSTVENIDNNLLLSCKVIIPPMNEQEQIINYLNKECSLIDDLIQTKSMQLEIIKRQRRALIFEYVTGKKRIKEAM